MSVFQKREKDKSGEMKTYKNWYISFQNHEGVTRRWAAFSDKKRSEDLLRKIEMLVQHRITNLPSNSELQDWLESLPAKWRKKLAKEELIGKQYLAASESLMQHIEDYKQHLIAKNTRGNYAEQTYNRLKRMIDGCDLFTYQQITSSAIENYLHKLRQPQREVVTDAEGNQSIKTIKGITTRTSNFYMQAMQQFYNWMIREGRATSSPVEHLNKLNPDIDATPRRAMTTDELSKLFSWLDKQPKHKQSKMQPAERKLLYLVAMYTGLRSSELASLTRTSFDLTSDTPTVRIHAKKSKRGKHDRIQLHPDLIEPLRRQIAKLLPDEPVFNMPSKSNVAKRFRKDFEGAGIPYENEKGEVLNFHCLRHTYITLLSSANVNPKVAQEMARHCNIKLTLDHYTHLQDGQVQEALTQIPSMSDMGVSAPIKPNAADVIKQLAKREVEPVDAAPMQIAEYMDGDDEPEPDGTGGGSGAGLDENEGEIGAPYGALLGQSGAISYNQMQSNDEILPQEEGVKYGRRKTKPLVKQGVKRFKRRGRDSNPRYGENPYDDLANRCLQPLGHLSEDLLIYDRCLWENELYQYRM